MKWEEIDLKKAEWRFTLSKTNTSHIVPLPRQAIEILQDLQPLTGSGVYVMPSQRAPKGDRPMSDAAITAAYRAMGIDQSTLVAHGWRATARTILVEDLKYPVDIVEQQLGHSVKDALGRAYNRTQFLKERRLMMQAWADYLDSLRAAIN
jgi:integrase